MHVPPWWILLHMYIQSIGNQLWLIHDQSVEGLYRCSFGMFWLFLMQLRGWFKIYLHCGAEYSYAVHCKLQLLQNETYSQSSFHFLTQTNTSYICLTSWYQISWVEFTIRILFFQQYNSPRLFHLGILFVMLGQTCRTLAMVTCGESFNHYIQRDKKDNHVLVTNGM